MGARILAAEYKVTTAKATGIERTFISTSSFVATMRAVTELSSKCRLIRPTPPDPLDSIRSGKRLDVRAEWRERPETPDSWTGESDWEQ